MIISGGGRCVSCASDSLVATTSHRSRAYEFEGYVHHEGGEDDAMVLIIDDESDLRGLIVDVLESQGIEAQAVGPYDALLMLRQLEPEVVLLDVVMPGMDGYNILKYMRSDARLRNSFVLMLTGKARTQDLQVGIDLGADDYLTKPFAVEELVARVRIGLNAAGRISA